MEAKNKKLGIIAGGGTLPRSLIEHCRKTGRDFFVIAVEGNADPALLPKTFRICGSASARPAAASNASATKRWKKW